MGKWGEKGLESGEGRREKGEGRRENWGNGKLELLELWNSMNSWQSRQVGISASLRFAVCSKFELTI